MKRVYWGFVQNCDHGICSTTRPAGFHISSAIQVVCMALLREEGSAAGEFPGGSPVRDAQRTVPGALLDERTADMAHTFGLAEDQRAEVAMLMNATPVDFRFLQRRDQSEEVRAMLR